MAKKTTVEKQRLKWAAQVRGVARGILHVVNARIDAGETFSRNQLLSLGLIRNHPARQLEPDEASIANLEGLCNEALINLDLIGPNIKLETRRKRCRKKSHGPLSRAIQSVMEGS